MVALLGRDDLDAYRGAGDPLLALLRELEESGDAEATSQRWLLDSLPKRLVYDRLYGDLLRTRRDLAILDVGGGFSSLTRSLARRHHYALLEVFAHDALEQMRAVSAELGGIWVGGDWHRWESEEEFDVIVANDLFPNVDQRLVLFLERFLPRCAELRLSLAYYNHPRFYETKRVDADEVLFVVPWNGEQLWRALEPFGDRFEGTLEELPHALDSLFANGRQVAVLTMRGDLDGVSR